MIQRQPEFQSVGRSFPDSVAKSKSEYEALHGRCRSLRRSANTIFWKAMQISIQGARSAFGAEGWRRGMSDIIEMTKIFDQVMMLNQRMYPR